MYRSHVKWRSMKGALPIQVSVSGSGIERLLVEFGYLTAKSHSNHTHTHIQ